MVRENWLRNRKNYIGGSDIGAIVGVNKYRTALDVYLDKTSDTINEEGNNYTHWGNVLEDVIAKEYARVTGNDVIEPAGTIYDGDDNFLAVNIDRYINSSDHLLECKTASYHMASEWGEEGTDQIPDSYKCQVAYYLAITGASKVDIAVLIGGNDFRIYKYERDMNLENKLLKIAKHFWNHHIKKRIPPEASSLNDLNSLYPVSNGSKIEISDEVSEAIRKLKELKDQSKQIDQESESLQKTIKEYMCDNEVLVDSAGEIYATWKTGKGRKTLDTKKLKEENNLLYQQYLHEGKVLRTLRIK